MHTSPQDVTARPSPRARLAFAALLLGMLMAQLDTNIVVAALPSITTDLGSASAVAGVTAVYLLTVTVSTPVHGKLGDLFGRRAVFHAALALFAVGSLSCALAPSMPVLVAARGIQGLGGGGLVVTAISALAQMFTREEMMRRQGYLTGLFALSALAGPPLGGLLAAGPGWRWIFLVNLPLCVAGALLGSKGLPGKPQTEAGASFDWAGTLLVTAVGAGVVALGVSQTLAHSPLGTAALLAGVTGCAVAFVKVERRAATALIPPSLFHDRGLARSIVSTGLAGIALFGTFTFIPLAVQEGTGAGSGTTGLLLLALTGGQLLSTTTFSLLARRHPALPRWGYVALTTGVVGMTGLAVLPALHGAPRPFALAVAVTGMAMVGAALGLSLQAYTLIAQGRARADRIGATMGTLTFARQLGGSLGTAVFGRLLLTAPSERTGLIVVLATAAGLLAAALATAPRPKDDPTHPG
ncbi:MFS transporter [Streptomyces sp. SID3343]|uniref:MFS transporter n=1 Tax=Streptomyces sp. SID3343 TaxID=2690260 RepID=UPI00136EEE1E|nr:MFS transporter [Streptomyces sp. SID3343]MYV97378.1 MFS transporter [Streptomyces sp. SID3343]